MHYFRALAIDYDGTLTLAERPADSVLEGLAEVRRLGLKVVLCTGRILEELLAIFPDAPRWFDGMVMENGAVQWTETGGARALALPVSEELVAALTARAVEFQQGHVLLATWSRWAHVVLEEIERLGLDCQLIRNRDALMVLPGGVTKGTGLFALLGDLGISHHSTIGIGDAENDHSLLERCELGVAVSNAVPSLAAHADVVLAEPNGPGVLHFLGGPLLRGQVQVQPKRWQVELGRFLDGSAARLPGSGVNTLITGEPGSGKSWLAGLYAERLVLMGYSLAIFDPEGDHGGLARHRAVLNVGGAELPRPADLAVLLDTRFISVVIDMSGLPREEKRAYYQEAMAAIVGLRARAGRPHWIFLEEADQLLGRQALPGDDAGLPPWGFCLITYQPAALAERVLRAIDYELRSVSVEDASGWRAETLNSLNSADAEEAIRVLRNERFFAQLKADGGERPFTLARRESAHVRHWHKYITTSMPWHRRFHFRRPNAPTGVSAGNVVEFANAIERIDRQVLRHHLQHGDFSRWFAEVLRDGALATRLREIEHALTERDGDIEAVRDRVVSAVHERYATSD